MADSTFDNIYINNNVGIGTNEPTSRLHIVSPTGISNNVFVENIGGSLLKISTETSSASIGTENAFPLSIQTDGVPRIAISGTGNITITEPLTVQNSLTVTGNVGIGTPSPDYTLDVNGTLNVTEIYKNGAPWRLTTSEIADNAITATKIQDGSVGQAELAIGAVTELKIANNAVTEAKLANNAVTEAKLANGAVTIAKLAADARPIPNQWSTGSSGSIFYNGGNVGIGIAPPVAPLHIAGGNWNPNDTEGDLRLGDGTYKFKIGIARGGGGAGDVRIRAQGGTNRIMIGGGANDALLIQNNDVSIPSGRLNFGAQVRQMINLWSNEYGIGVQAGTTYFRSGANFCWFRGGSHNDTRDNAGGGARLMALNEAGDLILSARTNPEADPSKSPCRALVDLNKKLVINLANDYSDGVQIDGTVRFTGAIGGFTANNVDEWPNVVWYRDIAAGWDEGLIKHASNKGFFGRAGFGIHIHASRDWGIWSTNWTPLLGVEGGTGNVLARGSIRQASSRNLKENIDNLTAKDAIKTLKELNPIKFNYKTDDRKETHLGFIAEDVPELVASHDRQGLSSMDIVAVLTKVLQEQQKTISVLAEKVKALEAQQGCQSANLKD